MEHIHGRNDGDDGKEIWRYFYKLFTDDKIMVG